MQAFIQNTNAFVPLFDVNSTEVEVTNTIAKTLQLQESSIKQVEMIQAHERPGYLIAWNPKRRVFSVSMVVSVPNKNIFREKGSTLQTLNRSWKRGQTGALKLIDMGDVARVLDSEKCMRLERLEFGLNKARNISGHEKWVNEWLDKGAAKALRAWVWVESSAQWKEFSMKAQRDLLKLCSSQEMQNK